jgi:hypothetical protein
MIWEGKPHYNSLEEGMQDLEANIAAWMEENL